MKNKKSIYILLPIVLLIWGLVVYQFFSFSQNDPIESNLANEFTLKPFKIKPRDTFVIDVNYRDPFLGKMYQAHKEVSGLKKASKNLKPNPPATPLVLRTVIYKGIVSDTKDKTKIFMLIIDGHTFLMKKGDLESDVLLKDGSRESITIKNNGTIQTILLQV